MQAYSDPTREDDPRALPDVEVFQVDARTIQHEHRDFALERMREARENNDEYLLPSDLYGWYWWSCFPGCMPDSDPFGPFKTEADALADAREQVSA